MTRLLVWCGSAAVLSVSAASAQPCEPGWSKEYTSVGLGYPQKPRALAVFEVEGAPRVVVGGDIGFLPPLKGTGHNLAWYDGTMLDHVGGVDPSAPVTALLVSDHLEGPAMYAAGEFREIGELVVRYVARWDGQAWSALEQGVNNYPRKTYVRALVVFDDGSGPSLYAGGEFHASGDLSRELWNIARWDGQQWQAVGGGIRESNTYAVGQGVQAMAVHDDGTGAALFVAGLFDQAGEVSLQGLARWDGENWSAVGTPLFPPPGCGGPDCGCPTCRPNLKTVASFDDGTGPALYIGGAFEAPEAGAAWVARLRDGAWEATGKLLGHPRSYDEIAVETLSVQDLGGGPELYLNGTFMTAEPPPKVKDGGCLARWDGAIQDWVDLDGNPMMKAMTTFDSGDGARLWLAGPFFNAGANTPGGDTPSLMATLGPEGWKWIGTGGGLGSCLRVFDDGSGPAVYINNTGSAWDDFEPTSNGLIRLNADGWSSLGSWTDLDPSINLAEVSQIEVIDLGQGPQLFVNAEFYHDTLDQDTKVFMGIARWDGEHWSRMGQDFRELAIQVAISFFSYDDGTGRTLYFFPGMQFQDIYRLENGVWKLWAAADGKFVGNGPLETAIEFDDGTGPALWIGGNLGEIEGVPVSGIARYRPGTGWEAVGQGMDNHVLDFQVWDDGMGAALYASGAFTHADGKAINRIARWDGQTWQPLGNGLGADKNGYSSAEMMLWDDGSGPALWANGRFTTAGDNKPIKYIAKWDGTDWSGIPGSGVDFPPADIVGADIGQGPTIFATGGFSYADGYRSAGFAAYHFCPPGDCPADLDHNGSVDIFDFLTFVNLFNAADPAADCDAGGSLDLFDFLCFSNAFNAGC